MKTTPLTFDAHPRSSRNPRFILSLAVVAALTLASYFGVARAQNTDKLDTAPAPAAPSGPSFVDELALEQSRIADKYAKLEQLMLKMAELEGLTNPKRAQLLTRAVEQSKERLTKPQLDS